MTGNGWNGTLANGAAWAAGRNGSNAVSLNGTTQYVSLPSGVISSYNAMTISAWVNLSSVSNWMRIFDFGSGTNNYMYLSPQNGSNGKLRFAMKVNGSSEQVIEGTAALPTGEWHHVAITFSGSTGTFYVDGQQVGSSTSMFRPSDLGVTTAYSGLCSNELNMLRTVLGEQAQIKRIEHILSGENRCVYKVTEK